MKLFRRISVVVTTMLIVALSACDESTTNENEADSNSWGETKGNIVILNAQATEFVESYENDSIIQFSSSTPENLIPNVGTILYVPESDKTPFGYLGKIITVEKSNGFKVYTETAPLDEVFGNLSIDSSIESIDGIEEVLDAEGNPIEYEIVDSLFQELDNKPVATSRAGSFYLKDKLIKFPFKIYNGKSGNQLISISGNAYAGFKKFSLGIDINNSSTSYVDLNVTPCVGLNATSKVKLAGGKIEAKDILIGKMTLRATIPTPAGIPIIVPITFYIYGTCGASGELTATLNFKPEFSTNWNVKFNNGQWSCNKNDSPSKNPWVASEFEVKGEVYSGTKLGLLVGLYSATSGIGINVIPKYSISCSASIKSENILNINPLVDQTLKISSEAYCVAKIFCKQIGKATFQFPDYVLWNEKVYLLPQYTDFNAIGNGLHGKISYKIDQHYFLKFLGFRHGLTIFDNDKTTELETAYPSTTKVDEQGYCYYDYTTKELSDGKTYYASPTIYGVNKKFHGEKHEFLTETPNFGHIKEVKQINANCSSGSNNGYIEQYSYSQKYVVFEISAYASILKQDNWQEWGVYYKDVDYKGSPIIRRISSKSPTISEDIINLSIMVFRSRFDVIDSKNFIATKSIKMGIYKKIDGKYYYNEPIETLLKYNKIPKIEIYDVVASEPYDQYHCKRFGTSGKVRSSGLLFMDDKFIYHEKSGDAKENETERTLGSSFNTGWGQGTFSIGWSEDDGGWFGGSFMYDSQGRGCCFCHGWPGGHADGASNLLPNEEYFEYFVNGVPHQTNHVKTYAHEIVTY